MAAPRNDDFEAENEDLAMDEQAAGAEDLDDKPKSIILHIVKQLTRGQDLTKVMIPTYFLEPRSLLEKFCDLWAHPQLVIE